MLKLHDGEGNTAGEGGVFILFTFYLISTAMVSLVGRSLMALIQGVFHESYLLIYCHLFWVVIVL